MVLRVRNTGQSVKLCEDSMSLGSLSGSFLLRLLQRDGDL